MDVVSINTVNIQRTFITSPRWRPVLLFALTWLPIAGTCPMRGQNYSNTTPINVAIGGPTIPYPSSINVSRATGAVVRVTVTLRDIAHEFPDDLDVLLVGPGGETVMLMSDAGGSTRVGGVSLTFSADTGVSLPDTGQITSGTYRPTDYQPGDVLPGPAPTGPYATDLRAFDGANPNGTWQLFVSDDTSFNGGGGITGGWVLNLELAEPPNITKHPQNQTVSPGAEAVFSVEVTGTPPFGYQWLRNSQVIVPFGLGGDSLVVSNVQVASAGTYSVVVTNAASRTGVASSNAVLNVLGPLTLVESPRDISVDPGETVEFNVTAAGDPPLLYQWLLNSAVLVGETNSTLALDNVQATDGGAFSVTVLNNNEALTTKPALLVVNDATDPPLQDDFADRPHLQGLEGMLQGDSSRATSTREEPIFTGGGKTVWCEWTAPKDGIATFAARGSAFDTLLGVFTGGALGDLKLITMDDDAGGFQTSKVQFNASEGTTYQIMLDGFDYEGIGGMFTLSWQLKPTAELIPVIASPPVSQAVLAGSNVTFKVITETPGVSYQWFFDGAAIPGATGNVYTVMQAGPDDVGFYFARLTSGSGLALQSPLAELQIGTTPDALMHDKFQNVSQTSANGNRPSAGFISIGIGVTDVLQAPATNAGAINLTPCNNPFSTKYRYRGLEATNDGTIFVSTEGGQIFTRLAVYLDPMSLNLTPLDCDTGSAPAMQPGTLLFQATNGARYMVVAEAYQADGDIDLTSTMGIAPDISTGPEFCLIPSGGGAWLNMPATNWVPVPDCQWQLNGQDLQDATNTSLLITNFSLMQTGAYSVVMSNFVRVTTNTVAIIDLAGPLTLEPALLTNNGTVDLLITITNAAPFLLVTKTNLDSNLPWLPLVTNLGACQTFLYTNTHVLADPVRFFRAVPWPPPEP